MLSPVDAGSASSSGGPVNPTGVPEEFAPLASSSSSCAHAECQLSIALCRVCWDPEDAREGGLLLSPCSCKGTVQHIHLRCLQRWQAACKARGQQSRGRRCDLCSARFVDPLPGVPRAPSLQDLCANASGALKRSHLPDLLLRTYLGASALRVLASSASASLCGASRGMLLGARLIDRQLSMVLHNAMLRTFIQPGLFLVPTFCCFPFYVQVASLQLLTTTTAGLLLGGCSGSLSSIRALLTWHADMGARLRRCLAPALAQGLACVARGVLRIFCRAKR